jgi:hypothetical protein
MIIITMNSLQQQWMGAHHNNGWVHIITLGLLRNFFVLFFMITVQVNGAELVFAVIAEEVSIPAFSTK